MNNQITFTPASNTSALAQPHHMKILLVEDHDRMAKISCDLLKMKYGHEVEHVSTGCAALEALRKSVPDLVLLDLSLPDMHGYKLAEQIRANRDLDQVILVALTGFGITGDEESSKEVGIDAHYRKPMDFGELAGIKRAKLMHV